MSGLRRSSFLLRLAHRWDSTTTFGVFPEKSYDLNGRKSDLIAVPVLIAISTSYMILPRQLWPFLSQEYRGQCIINSLYDEWAIVRPNRGTGNDDSGSALLEFGSEGE